MKEREKWFRRKHRGQGDEKVDRAEAKVSERVKERKEGRKFPEATGGRVKGG